MARVYYEPLDDDGAAALAIETSRRRSHTGMILIFEAGVLATRLLANDDAEYFGAFLNRTNARILIDAVNQLRAEGRLRCTARGRTARGVRTREGPA